MDAQINLQLVNQTFERKRPNASSGNSYNSDRSMSNGFVELNMDWHVDDYTSHNVNT